VSLDKAIKHGKEHRKPFRGSARFDRSCRHQGTCEYCRRNRTVAAARQFGKQKLSELFGNSSTTPSDA
jgi:hypothetical protein